MAEELFDVARADHREQQRPFSRVVESRARNFFPAVVKVADAFPGCGREVGSAGGPRFAPRRKNRGDDG